MTKNLLLSCCVLTGFSFGQTFTSSNEYQVGDSQAMFLCDSAATTLENVTGTGVTWDYSSFGKMPNPDRTYQVTANTNTNFPNATKVVSIEGILDTYLISDGTNRSSEGFQFTDANLGAVIANFSAGDNLSIMDYDFAINDNLNDVFSGTLTGTGVINPACSGLSESTFDGIGTLILSSTVTKTNVQRHHLYTELNGTSLLGPVILKIDQFDYFDFTTSDLPVLSMTHLKIFLNGAQATSLKFLLNSVDPAISASSQEIENESFQVYPNPAEENLVIKGENFDGKESFTITDLTGKAILTSNESKINVQNLTSGVYLILVNKNGSVMQQKFVKK